MKRTLGMIAATWLGFAALASAQTAGTPYDELQKQIDALKREVDGLKASGAASSDKEAAEKKLEWGGFAEMAYQNFSGRKQNGNQAGLRDEADLSRVSLDAVYSFSKAIRAKFELESLHAGIFSNNNKGTFDVEQAWVEDRLHPMLGLRGGLVIVPLGLVNEHHRPVDYYGVFRTNVEQFIVPSTWREMGAGFFGDIGPVSYRTYAMSGLTAVSNASESNKGFLGSTGIKDGRTLGANSFTQSGSWAGRADYAFMKNSFVGGALYVGRADQGLTNSSIPLSLWETHLKTTWRGAELRALYAEGTIGNADSVNQTQAVATPGFSDFVGRRFFGGYVEAAYNFFTVLPGRADALAPFIRFERYDTATQVSSAFKANPATSRVEYTVGADYRPAPHVVVKSEYQWLLNGVRTGVNEWNLGLGFDF